MKDKRKEEELMSKCFPVCIHESFHDMKYHLKVKSKLLKFNPKITARNY